MPAKLYAVQPTETATPRQLAREALVAYKEKQSTLPPLPRAEIHDPNRVDLDRPAKTLDVNKAVRSATFQIKGK